MRFNDLFLVSARIVGDIGLANARIPKEFGIGQCRIEGAIDISRARADNLIGVYFSTVTGPFNIASLEARSDVNFGLTNFKSGLVGRGAHIAGTFNLVGSQLQGDFEADELQTRNLLMYSDPDKRASFKDVWLRNAQIAGQVVFKDAEVDGVLNAEGIQAGDLYLLSTGFKGIDLHMARAARRVDISGVQVGGGLNAETLQANALYLRGSRIMGNINAAFVAIGGNLDLRGSTLRGLNLTGASIKSDLQMGDADMKATYEFINFRNAHVGYLSDEKAGWEGAGRLALTGFTFDRLGATKEADADPNARPKINLDMDWWDQWARRDLVYSPSPYTQLTSALKSAGEADAANDIRFLGRERAREAACKKGALTFDCSLQTVLSFVGYGIGFYAFRSTLLCIVVLTAFGVVIWRAVPEVRKEKQGLRGWLWCVGVSLWRVLPVIELDKNFAAFFEGPFRPKLTLWQGTAFYVLRVVGIMLGAALVAAVSGLTQGP